MASAWGLRRQFIAVDADIPFGYQLIRADTRLVEEGFDIGLLAVRLEHLHIGPDLAATTGQGDS